MGLIYGLSRRARKMCFSYQEGDTVGGAIPGCVWRAGQQTLEVIVTTGLSNNEQVQVLSGLRGRPSASY